MEKNNKQKKKCPGYKHFLHPTLKALYSLGGSGSNEEIYKTVLSIMKLSDEVIDELHSFTMTEVEYKLMWARTYLKNYGAVENSRQGVWALTSKGVKLACVDNIDTKEIIDFTNKKRALAQSDVKIDAAVEEHNDWRKSISYFIVLTHMLLRD